MSGRISPPRVASTWVWVHGGGWLRILRAGRARGGRWGPWGPHGDRDGRVQHPALGEVEGPPQPLPHLLRPRAPPHVDPTALPLDPSFLPLLAPNLLPLPLSTNEMAPRTTSRVLLAVTTTPAPCVSNVATAMSRICNRGDRGTGVAM